VMTMELLRELPDQIKRTFETETCSHCHHVVTSTLYYELTIKKTFERVFSFRKDYFVDAWVAYYELCPSNRNLPLGLTPEAIGNKTNKKSTLLEALLDLREAIKYF